MDCFRQNKLMLIFQISFKEGDLENCEIQPCLQPKSRLISLGIRRISIAHGTGVITGRFAAGTDNWIKGAYTQPN